MNGITQSTLEKLQKKHQNIPRPIRQIYSVEQTLNISEKAIRSRQKATSMRQEHILRELQVKEIPKKCSEASQLITELMILANVENGNLKVTTDPIKKSDVTAMSFSDEKQTTIAKTNMKRLLNAVEIDHFSDSEKIGLLLTFSGSSQLPISEVCLEYSTARERNNDLHKCRDFLQKINLRKEYSTLL